MPEWMWVALGGAAGSSARYAVSVWVQQAAGGRFPVGTLTVNVVGSFLLGLVLSAGLHVDWLGPQTRLVLAVGVLGGFTTYSTFSYETARLIQDGAWGPALLNVGLTLVLGLAATFAGLATARAFAGA